MAKLNQLNLFMQGEHTLLRDAVDKISGFNDKLRLWDTRWRKQVHVVFKSESYPR